MCKNIVEKSSGADTRSPHSRRTPANGISGRPSFNALQNYSSATTPLIYCVFDVMVTSGKDVIGEQLSDRRLMLARLLSKLADPIPQFLDRRHWMPVLKT
jgi:ATP-dependent DNA ligase